MKTILQNLSLYDKLDCYIPNTSVISSKYSHNQHEWLHSTAIKSWFCSSQLHCYHALLKSTFIQKYLFHRLASKHLWGSHLHYEEMNLTCFQPERKFKVMFLRNLFSFGIILVNIYFLVSKSTCLLQEVLISTHQQHCLSVLDKYFFIWLTQPGWFSFLVHHWWTQHNKANSSHSVTLRSCIVLSIVCKQNVSNRTGAIVLERNKRTGSTLRCHVYILNSSK